MKEINALYQPSPPFIIVDEYTQYDSEWLPNVRYKDPENVAVIRVLRANKMRSWQGLMDEFGAALQFFEGFGENTAALEDCLTRLDEWLPGTAYILEVLAGDQLLSNETQGDFVFFLRLLDRVGKEWAKPIVDNPPYDRSAVPFHVVIKVPASKMPAFLLRVNACEERPPIDVVNR